MSPDERRSERQEHPEHECRLDERERVVGEHRDAKPVMDAANAAASKPSGLPLVRATRPSRRTLRTMSHIHPKSPTRPTSRNRPSHWLSRIGAFRSGLFSPVCLVPTPCPRIGLCMPSMSLGLKLARPLMRVGSAASVLCWAIKLFVPPSGKNRPFTVPMDPGATSLMSNHHGDHERQERTNVTRSEPQEHDDGGGDQPGSASGRRSPSCPRASRP